MPHLTTTRVRSIHWTTTQTVAPDVEPVSVADARAHMRIDSGEEDDYILALTQAARG